MKYYDSKKIIGHTMVINGTEYTISGPIVDNFALVKFVDGNQIREAIFNYYQPAISEEKIPETNFENGSVLSYGSTAALVLTDKKNNMFGLFDVQSGTFVPNEAISMESLMQNGSPFSEYNRRAFSTLCSNPNLFTKFLEENKSTPLTQEAKVMFFDLANRIINMQKTKTLNSIANALYQEEPNPPQKV